MEWLWEIVFEIAAELIVEGGIEAAGSKRLPKPLRYVLLALAALFFLAVVGALGFFSFVLMEKSLAVGLLFTALALGFLTAGALSFRKRISQRR